MGILPMFHGLEARATSPDELPEPINRPNPLAFGARNTGREILQACAGSIAGGLLRGDQAGIMPRLNTERKTP